MNQVQFARLWRGIGALLVLTGLTLASPALAQSRQDGNLINTVEGPVHGALKGDVRVFSAIPYAAPPVGPLRFRPPQPVVAWSTVFEAIKAPPACPQVASGDPAGRESRTEDCLYLNVWAPVKATHAQPLPVMVWIHGGGFNGGFSGASQYDAIHLSGEGDVVVVSINYRLGLLGLMMSSALDGQEQSGNYLIRDQQAALRWVQRNIGGFGGDPKNVTIVGESAGANSVLALLASPASKGLFHKVIAQSPTENAHTLNRAQTDKGISKDIIVALGCAQSPDVAACLRALPADAFIKTKGRVGLVQDNEILPVDPYEAYRTGAFNHVPVLIGSNLNEGALFVAGAERRLGRGLTDDDDPSQSVAFFGNAAEVVRKAYPSAKFGGPAQALSQAVTDRRFACYAHMARVDLAAFVPVYGYEMTEPNPVQQQPFTPPVDLPNSAYHTADLAYLFNSDANGAPLVGRAGALSERLRQYWTNFARTGSPTATPSQWPGFRAKAPVVLNLVEPPSLLSDVAERHNCSFLNANGLVTRRWE